MIFAKTLEKPEGFWRPMLEEYLRERQSPSKYMKIDNIPFTSVVKVAPTEYIMAFFQKVTGKMRTEESCTASKKEWFMVARHCIVPANSQFMNVEIISVRGQWCCDHKCDKCDEV